LIIPMMIGCFAIRRYGNRTGSVLIAYMAELVSAPILYAIVPACGPVYAFGANWLHPPATGPGLIRLVGMPNAFPSLHVGTALVLALFAPGKLWRAIALAFLAATALATLATGEHYILDLVPGLAFGCFAASVGYRKTWAALFYLGVTLLWSLAVRFDYQLLIAHPGLLRSFSVLTIAFVVLTVFKQWSAPSFDPSPSDSPSSSAAPSLAT